MMIDTLEPRRLFSAVSFDVDPALSQLRIDAYFKVPHVGKVKLSPQADGLNTAALDGLLVADITSKGVKLDDTSAIDLVAHEGAYSPNESPADFALKGKVKKFGVNLANAKAALRDAAFSLDGPRGGLKSNGKFAVKNAKLTATEGTIDYTLDSKFGDAEGYKPFAGLSATADETNGTLTGAAGSRTIALRLNVVLTKDLKSSVKATLTLSGTIVAHEKVDAVSQAVAATPAVARASVATSIFGDDRTIL